MSECFIYRTSKSFGNSLEVSFSAKSVNFEKYLFFDLPLLLNLNIFMTL